MNRNEAVQVVKLLKAAWPHSHFPDEAAALWLSDLEELADADIANAAFRSFRRNSEQVFMPTWAQFEAAYQRERKQRAVTVMAELEESGHVVFEQFGNRADAEAFARRLASGSAVFRFVQIKGAGETTLLELGP